MIKLAVSGCCGKMGSRIINLALADKELKIVCALEREGHSRINDLIGEVQISDKAQDIKRADVLIEFTTPEATLEHLELLLKYKLPAVIGTTGLSEEEKSKIKSVSKTIPIFFSPNMSMGVNLLFRLVKEASLMLSKDYKVNIQEAHHAHKKDAPSGTAKHLAEIIKKVSGNVPIDIKSIREGEIIGDHRVIFDGALDTVELSHFAKNRDIFARGALEGAKWIVRQRPGLFDMQDFLKGR